MLPLKIVFTLFLSIWLGQTVFLSLVAAPVLFGNLPLHDAGNVMTLLFPWYYRVGYLCGVVVLGAAMYLWRRAAPPRGGWLAIAGLAGLGLAGCLYAGGVVQPRAHEVRAQVRREATPGAAKVEFDRLHELAVRLNGGVLLATLAIAGVAASRLR